MRALLESHGLDVEIYASAREFLAHAPSGERTCLVLDLYMAEMDGVDLLTELKRQGSELPVIVMTGHGESLRSRSALQAGARELLNKPFQDDVLMKSIEAATGTSRS